MPLLINSYSVYKLFQLCKHHVFGYQSMILLVYINDTHQIDPRLTLLEQGRDIMVGKLAVFTNQDLRSWTSGS